MFIEEKISLPGKRSGQRDDQNFYFDFESCQIGLFINNSLEDNEFYFGKNLEKYKDEIIDVCERFNINNKFELYNFKKETSVLISESFNAEKDFELLPKQKMLLLQKTFSCKNEILFSSDFIIEAIKTFSILYPLYCFSITHNPLKLIEEFENNFGIVAY